MSETDLRPEPLGPIPTAGRGDPTQVESVADLLVEADDPVFVLGDGVARSGYEAVAAAMDLAEATGARVHGEILASEVNFPTGHEQFLSYIPPNEGLASMLMNTDTLLFVGCSTNTTLLRHDSPLVREDAVCLHVGDDADELAKRQHADAAVLGDPGEVMAELAERVGDRLADDERDARLEKVRAMKESLASTVESMGVDETPEGETRPSKADLVDALEAAAPDAFVVDEGITAKYPLLTRWEMDAEGMLSNKGGGLGYGLPASIGAAFAEREREAEGGDARQVLGYIGDGSYLYYPNAMYTAARHDLDMTVVVPDNRNYRILKDNTNTLFGGSDEDHEFVGMDFEPPVDIPANARSHGATAGQAETPDELEGAVEEALSTPGPYVLDVLVHD